MSCRSLHWERGLKPTAARQTWRLLRRSLHWERGLKQIERPNQKERHSRSLHWERGLKPMMQDTELLDIMSLPSLGAWIETHTILMST